MSSSPYRITLVLALTGAVVGTLAVGCKDKAPTPPVATTGTPGTTEPAPPTGNGGTPAATTVKLPSYWVSTDVDKNWPGKRWDQIDLFSFIKEKPQGLDTGTKYVIFFGRTCEHCEEMFSADLATNPGLAAQVTAIEVPVEKDKLRGDDAWAMPDTKCTFGELRLGPNWIMTTPVTVRLQDGVVQCAQEGGHTDCMN